MKSPIKIVALLFAISFCLLALMACRQIGFTYVRLIENDPLSNPFRVIKSTPGKLELEDGRSVELWASYNDAELQRSLRESDNWIELAPTFDDHVEIYVKSKVFICGTSFPTITIPLSPVDVPKYRRRLIDTGKIAIR